VCRRPTPGELGAKRCDWAAKNRQLPVVRRRVPAIAQAATLSAEWAVAATALAIMTSTARRDERRRDVVAKRTLSSYRRTWRRTPTSKAENCVRQVSDRREIRRLTASHRGACCRRKSLNRMRDEVFCCRLVALARFAFQACSLNHSDISPSLESTTCEWLRPDYRTRR
jgi:hypothetical protein